MIEARITRRKFVRGAMAVAGATAVPLSAWAQVTNANDDIRVAVVGHNSRGSGHIDTFNGKGTQGCRVVALCDADLNVMERDKKKKFTDKNKKVELYQDYRALLAAKDQLGLDAIVTATPNHWHSLVGIWACQAGLHAFIEKPVSHNIWEGRQLVNAARKYDRILQTGTQNRSDSGKMAAIKYIQDGNLGPIKWSRGFCYKRRKSIGKVGPEGTPIPDHIDYDLWCGPAEKQVPLMREKLHYDWHWVWNTGNGDLGNQGIHEMDIARWALGESELAPAVISVGGRVGYDDDGETANEQIVFLDYQPAPLIFEVRGLARKKDVNDGPKYIRRKVGQGVGNCVQCEDGFWIGGIVFDNDGNKVSTPSVEGGGGHFQNFLDALRSGKREDLNAEILEGHLSSALCHMGNVSHRLGQAMKPEAIKERLQAWPAAVESLERMQTHLADNEIDLEKYPLSVGPWLKLDPKTEKFTGPFAEEANKLATRDYRKPFVVPEINV